MDRVQGAMVHGQSRSMVDRGQRVRWRFIGARRTGAGARRCSLVMEGEDEPVEAVLTGDGGVATWWRTRGSERRWLELVARVKRAQRSSEERG
jgi:hypothetical protein